MFYSEKGIIEKALKKAGFVQLELWAGYRGRTRNVYVHNDNLPPDPEICDGLSGVSFDLFEHVAVIGNNRYTVYVPMAHPDGEWRYIGNFEAVVTDAANAIAGAIAWLTKSSAYGDSAPVRPAEIFGHEGTPQRELTDWDF